MTALSLRNPIAILMICVGVVVFAAVVTPRMSVDTFPELTPPVLIVGEVAPGLAAKDVEKAVAWRIERYVAATPGVDHVESLSRNNFALIYVWLKWGTDLTAAQTLVQSEAAFAMAGAPKSLGLLPPFVLQYDPSNAPVCQVVITGAGYSGSQLYDYAQNYVEPQIEGIDGVGSAPVDGGRPRQINIVVDPIKAQARHVTAEDVAAAVSRSNALLPSGEFLATGFDANVYTNAVPKDVAAIGEGTVKVVDGKPVLIKDVARVEDGGTPATQSVSVGGRDAVYLNVLRIPGGNTIQIVDAVKAKVTKLSNMPQGMEAKVYFDQSTFVRNSYDGLQREILQALFLIALVILLFLQSVRGTLIVSIAIPLSFAITLIVLYATGQTLNAFTLGGLTLAMGRLVDDAVVVLESVHRHQRMGLDPSEAALRGAGAVALPVLASTLTTMAVLLPVLLLAGLAKRLFAPLALTVAVAMIASYFVSMAVTPVVCRYFLGHGSSSRLAKVVEGAIDGLAGAYAATLRRVLPARVAVIAASVALVLGSAWAAARLPTTFFPDIDESMDMIYVRFAPGVSVQKAASELTRMGEALSRDLPKDTIRMIVTNVGMPQEQRSLLASPNVAPNTGFLRLAFAPEGERKLSQQALAVRARAILNRDFPGVELLQAPGGLVASVFSNGYQGPLVVEVQNDNLDILDAQARAVAEIARTVPGVRDVRESLQMDYPEIRVDTDREKAGFVGTSLRDAAQTTLEATTGNINTPGVWVDAANGRAYYVVTFYDGAKVPDAASLGTLPLSFSSKHRPVLLGAYSDVRRSVGAVAVERSRMARVAHVLMQTEGRDLGSAARDLEDALRKDERTRGADFRFVGEVSLMRTTFSGLGLALALAVMVVFMIMASQFKSLRLPFVMLFTIPVALFGIDAALVAAGQGFSITALMGVLMVIGIAVSNGILLVDDANRRLGAGTPRVEAIVEAARSRFIPIMMTSLATIIGLVPTAMVLERGSEANQPLALAVVGGLTSSTLISLFLVPVMFLLFAPGGTKAPERLRLGPPAAAATAAAVIAVLLVPRVARAQAASAIGASPTPVSSAGAVLPAVVPPPAPPPPTPGPTPTQGFLGAHLLSLRLMLAKHIITQAEFDSAMRDLADTTGLRAADQINFVVGKWSTQLYGFAEADFIYDSTQSYIEYPGNTQVARPGTYAGDHGRMQFSPRFSRIGFRMRAPEANGIRPSALVETDFLQSSAAGGGLAVTPGASTTSSAYGSEQSFYTNPVLRIRHLYLKLETPVVDLLFGQTWQLFGWQPFYMPATTQIQGMPGELFARSPQVRVSKTVRPHGPVTLEIAASAARPPQRDSAVPEGEGGFRLVFNRWKGMYTSGSTNTAPVPASIGVTGDLRHISLPAFSATPSQSVGKTGTGIAGNFFLPILWADDDHKGNSLSLVGQAAYGYGISDLFTSLTGGVTFPPLPNPTGATPAPVYSADIDPGIAVYDRNGNLHFIQWLALLGGVQYYLPKLDGRLFASANYSHMVSPNTRDYFGSSSSVTSSFDWWDVTLLGDLTDAVRMGVEYAYTRNEYLDGVHAGNQRGQFTAWYIY